MKIVLKLVYEKETPGTIRYKEVTELGKPAVIGTQYVRKTTFRDGSPPESITFTMEWD